MSEKDEKSEALTKTEAEETGVANRPSQAVATSEHSGFTEEDCHADIDINIGYVKSYPYFMRDKKGKFILIDNETGDEVWEGEAIERAIIYKAHFTRVLYRGHADGRTDTNYDDWNEEEMTPVALSYDSKSPGNFEVNGHGEWLKDKELRQYLNTRVYIFAIFPDLPSGKENVVACSFGVSSALYRMGKKILKNSLAFFENECSNIPVIDPETNKEKPGNFPKQYWSARMFHVSDENEKGKDYDRICFQLRTNEKGEYISNFKGFSHYRESLFGYLMYKKIDKKHKDAIEYSESGLMAMGSQKEREIKDVTDPESGFNDTPASSPVND